MATPLHPSALRAALCILGLVPVVPAQGTGLGGLPAWTSTGNGDVELYGQGLGSAGDVNGDGYDDFLIGAPRADTAWTPNLSEGAAYLFYGGPAGPAATPDWRIENDTNTQIDLGEVLGCAGDVNGDGYDDFFIAAPVERTGISTGFGTVRVFHGGPAGPHGGIDAVLGDEDWYAECNTLGSAQLGTSVAGVGDVNADGYDDLLVGAPYATGAGGNVTGKVFLWLGSPLGLNGGVDGDCSNAAWIAEGDQHDALFGNKVFAAGDVDGDGVADIAVRARRHGLAWGHYLFVWTGVAGGVPGGMGSTFFEMAAPDPSAGFAIDVSAGDYNQDGLSDLAVGEYQALATVSRDGCVSMLTSNGSTLDVDPFRLCVGPGGGGWYGYDLGTGDFNGDGLDDLVVGEPFWGYWDMNNHWIQDGAVYVHDGLGSPGGGAGLDPLTSWATTGTQSGNRFGETLANAGDVNGDGTDDLLIGAPRYEVNGLSQVGQVWLYTGSGPIPSGCGSEAPHWMVSGATSESWLGNRVSSVGDVNGDGYEDFVAQESDDLGVRGPVMNLYRGGPGGPETTPQWSVEGPLPGRALFGWAVSGAGDVNGDGFDDILITDRGSYAGVTPRPGYAQVYHGSATLPSTSPDWTAQLATPERTDFGFSCDAAGDLNGDGFDDIVIGAPGHSPWLAGDPYPARIGAIFVWMGSATGVNQGVPGDENNADWWIWSTQYDDKFGWSVAGVGDVNGDGLDDLLVGAPLNVSGAGENGSTYLYYGRGGALQGSVSPDWFQAGQDEGSWFGELVAGGGDLNGDGYDDLAVCAKYDGPTGRVAVFHGGPSGPSSSSDLDLAGQPGAYSLGTGVRLFEDFNGDGYADLAVHALVSNPEKSEGRISLHYGGPNGASATAHWMVESDVQEGFLGTWNRFDGGDCDGDGRTDLMAGCTGWPGSQPGLVYQGALMLWYGSAGTRLTVEPATLAPGGVAAVTHLGGAPGAPIQLGVVTINGNTVAPILLAAGMVDASRCWTHLQTVPPATPAGVYGVRAGTLDDQGALILSNLVEVTVL